MNNILEVCCGSYYDAIQAYEAKAKRIELNAGLSVGGLTPSLTVLQKIKANTDLEVICMVRPRDAGFCYDEYDKQTMFEDAKLMLDNGADGIAFGFLNDQAMVDVETTRHMVDLIHSYHKCAVFHRAIDVTTDYAKAFEEIVSCGVDRILTSGAKANVAEGSIKVKAMQDLYGDQIEILAGCGINSTNATYVLERTGVNQIHASCKKMIKDVTSTRNSVNFSNLANGEYIVCDKQEVEAILEVIQ